jgi:hypothetical protein
LMPSAGNWIANPAISWNIKKWKWKDKRKISGRPAAKYRQLSRFDISGKEMLLQNKRDIYNKHL